MADRYRVERWTAYHAPNSAMLRYTLESEGFGVFQWADGPGIFYGLHKHAEEQTHWIVSGQLEIHVKGAGTFQLGPGDRDFMPAETYHTARVISNEAVVYLIGIKKPAPASKSPARKPKRKPATKRKPIKNQLAAGSMSPAKKNAKPKPAAGTKAVAKKPRVAKPSKRPKKKA